MWTRVCGCFGDLGWRSRSTNYFFSLRLSTTELEKGHFYNLLAVAASFFPLGSSPAKFVDKITAVQTNTLVSCGHLAFYARSPLTLILFLFLFLFLSFFFLLRFFPFLR
jgi:hypothetical protein